MQTRTIAPSSTITPSRTIAPMSPIVRLAEDGQPILLRPGRPEDALPLCHMHVHLSSQSVYNRYFGLRARLDRAEALRRLGTDADHAALVALVGTKLIALGELDRAGSTVAEVSLLVDDQFQGVGVGTLLLQELAMAAASAGLDTLTAECLVSNARANRVLRRSGLVQCVDAADDVVSVRLPLDELVLARLSSTRRPSTPTRPSAWKPSATSA